MSASAPTPIPVRTVGVLALRIAERNEANKGAMSIEIELDECLELLLDVYRHEVGGGPKPDLRTFRVSNFLGAAGLIRSSADRFFITDDGVGVLSDARKLP